MTTTELVTTEERSLRLEERRIALDERKLANEARASRTPEEAAFELEMRMATSLAQSPFLPTAVGKDPNERIAAAWGVLRYAAMLGVDAYVLAQQIHIVKGKLGFSTQFLIALVNGRANLQSELDWTVSGTWAAKDLTVTCSATDARGKVRSVTMTRAQVDTWGWAGTDPWKADPVLMMKYRTASQLIRLYFAGSVMGLTTTAEELRDDDKPAVTPARSGAAALGGAPAPRAIVDTTFTETPDYAAEAAALAERQRVEAAAAEQEARRTQAAPTDLTKFNAAVQGELGLDPEVVVTFAGIQGVDLASAASTERIAFFNTIKPGGVRRVALDGFIGTLSRSSNPDDDGAF